MKNNSLRLEVQQDGNRAGLYEGHFLVIGFKWREEVRAFDMIGSTKRWDDLILHNHALHYYLNRVLELLTAYRQEALKLAAQRKVIEDSMSGFLSVE